MERLMHDLRYGVRTLIKSPLFTCVAVVALALGIGANSAVFSVVNAVLLRPLQFKDPEQLAMLWGKFDKEGIPRNWISQPELFDLREQCQSYEDLAAYTTGGANLTGSGEPVRVSSAIVSPGFFQILGLQPAIGRTFVPEEEQPANSKVAVLGYGLWQSRFGGNPDVTSQTVQLNGETYAILGVMPAGFDFPEKSELWVPLALDRANLQSRGSHYLQLIGRRKPGVSLEQAQSELNIVAQTLQQQYQQNYPADTGFGLFLVPMHQQVVGEVRPALVVLLAAVGLVLLIACANVANLLLARATIREREVAVRTALGATRWRIVRQLLTESTLLALTGGAIGLLLAFICVKLFVAFGPRDIPRLEEISLDQRVIFFSLGLSVLTGLVFGLAPAFHLAKADLHESLKEGGRAVIGSGHQRLRKILVVSEVAVALVLLAGAGLMLKSFRRVLEVDPGFRTENVLTMRLALPQTRYRENKDIIRFYKELLDRIAVLPGVATAGAVSHLPLSGAYTSGTTIVEDSSGTATQLIQGYPYIEADRRVVSPTYFKALGIKLIDGRLLEESDNEAAPPVAVIDETFAKRFWPGGGAVGKRVVVGGTQQQLNWGRIVGVVSHVKHYALQKDGREQIYFPYLQRPTRSMFVTVLTAGDPSNQEAAVRAAVQTIDSDQPIYSIKSMDQLLSESVAQPRLNGILFGAFGVIAVILAAVGIYGVMSYSVEQRTHEIGVRMALGAQRRDVLRLIVGQGFGLTLTGVAIGAGVGLAAALAFTRVMSSLLFRVNATDPVTFVIVSLLLGVVALIACMMPARRAASCDPMIALRNE
jgi:putative ABC transport system permease protein